MVDLAKPLFVVPLPLGTVTSGNEVAGKPASHLGRHKAIGLKWQSSGATNVWARGDMGTAQDIDFCAVLSANALPATTFRLRLGDDQTEVDGTADYDSGAQTFISPSITRKDGLYNSFWELPATQTKRWWRLDIGSHTGDFSGSMLILGKKVQPTKFYDFDFEFGIDDTGKVAVGAQRVWDETPGVILRTVDMALNWLTETEFEQDFRPMIEAVGTTQPVYLCFGPENSEYRQNRTYYGIFSKAPYARGKRIPRKFGGEFQFLSII